MLTSTQPASAFHVDSYSPTSGKTLPSPNGHPVTLAGRSRTREAAVKNDAAVNQGPTIAPSNSHFNDSGRSVHYRVDPRSNDKVIQAINPATGEVIAEYSVNEFPALARSAGLIGILVDGRA